MVAPYIHDHQTIPDFEVETDSKELQNFITTPAGLYKIG